MDQARTEDQDNEELQEHLDQGDDKDHLDQKDLTATKESPVHQDHQADPVQKDQIPRLELLVLKKSSVKLCQDLMESFTI